MKNLVQIENQTIQDKIYTIRGMQVMIDRDLAFLYGVETRRLNEQVKRNIERFPEEFMFQLTKDELENWMSQIEISNKELMGLRKLPFAFTEQGVSMISTVLKTPMAVQTSIQIIKSFVNMRKFLQNNASLFTRIENIEKRQISYEIKTDSKLELVLSALEDKNEKPTQGIFYNGQIYDAYAFVNDLLKLAKKDVSIIDNYIDDTIFTLCSKYPNINFTIYTQNISKQLELDYTKYQKQYKNIELKITKNFHDRFLIIDEKEIYHLGASLKDLGNKVFAFSNLNIDINSFEIFKD
ncbi:ORF6N domain-containing protein [Aliarcobacter cryaerophilus]|uniref:ORF6N domain-containing protein n=1 Tax=Aliarcobacter TaxID=2321111 RepID=UPI00299FE1E5|nr:ORF6N domain-containing protein [Aliarcobacter skirrowii]MDX4050859.1 ORF6N domain-containing protein [Aliarcobacter skirrowii]